MTYRIDGIDVPAENPFQHDQLNRKPLIESLSGLINRLSGPFVMALDSSSGTGKTTLVRMLIRNLEDSGHRCIYFNAWKVDYATDPLIALVSSIDHMDPNHDNADNARLRKVKAITTALAQMSLAATVKGLTSGMLDVDEVIKAIASNSIPKPDPDMVGLFNQEKELLDRFREELTRAIGLLLKTEKKSSLVFFIDELDRCRPIFAIHLLERIKHLFDIENIVFVLSIDKKQIEASTRAVYGSEINATEYLRRFFDLEYGIPVPDTKDYTNSLITRFALDSVFRSRADSHAAFQGDKNHFVNTFDLLANAFELSLRARERCITRLRIVLDLTPEDRYLDPVLVALLIVLRSDKPEIYHRFIAGEKSPDDVMDHLFSLPGGKIQKSDISVIAMHAYLLLSDPDRDRARNRNQKLKVEAEGEQDEYAASLQRTKDFFTGLHRWEISLDHVARKIDLISRVRE